LDDTTKAHPLGRIRAADISGALNSTSSIALGTCNDGLEVGVTKGATAVGVACTLSGGRDWIEKAEDPNEVSGARGLLTEENMLLCFASLPLKGVLKCFLVLVDALECETSKCEGVTD